MSEQCKLCGNLGLVKEEGEDWTPCPKCFPKRAAHTCEVFVATGGTENCGLTPCEEAKVHKDAGVPRPTERVFLVTLIPCANCGRRLIEDGRVTHYQWSGACSGSVTGYDGPQYEPMREPDCFTCGNKRVIDDIVFDEPVRRIPCPRCRPKKGGAS